MPCTVGVSAAVHDGVMSPRARFGSILSGVHPLICECTREGFQSGVDGVYVIRCPYDDCCLNRDLRIHEVLSSTEFYSLVFSVCAESFPHTKARILFPYMSGSTRRSPAVCTTPLNSPKISRTEVAPGLTLAKRDRLI